MTTKRRGPTRSAVDLAEFQEDAVKKARKILARYDGVMVADSVGPGQDLDRQEAAGGLRLPHAAEGAAWSVPPSLRDDVGGELRDATISARSSRRRNWGARNLTRRVGRRRCRAHRRIAQLPQPQRPALRAPRAHPGRQRRARREGARKKVILLTATPINNDLLDLYNQLSLFTGGDRSYFAASGIGDLYRYFLAARRSTRLQDGAFALFNLLEEVVIRRTRAFIRSAYPEATIDGKKIHLPERNLKTVRYNLEATYAGIYDEIVSGDREPEAGSLQPGSVQEEEASRLTNSRPGANRRWSASSRAAISSASSPASTPSASACAARWRS